MGGRAVGEVGWAAHAPRRAHASHTGCAPRAQMGCLFRHTEFACPLATLPVPRTGKRRPHILHLKAIDRTGPRRGKTSAPNSRFNALTDNSPSRSNCSCHLPIVISALFRSQKVLAFGLMEMWPKKVWVTVGPTVTCRGYAGHARALAIERRQPRLRGRANCSAASDASAMH